MNIMELGAIGEMVGGVAVLATLVYLAVQTRNNTQAIRSSTYSQVADSFSALSLAVFQDPSTASLVTRSRSDPSSLTPEERDRYAFFLRSYMRRAENLYFQSQQGTLEADTWLGLRASIAMVLASEVAGTWWADNAHQFNVSFRRFAAEEAEAQRSST